MSRSSTHRPHLCVYRPLLYVCHPCLGESADTLLRISVISGISLFAPEKSTLVDMWNFMNILFLTWTKPLHLIVLFLNKRLAKLLLPSASILHQISLDPQESHAIDNLSPSA